MKSRQFTALGSLLVAAVLALAVWMLVVWVASRPALNALIDLTPQRVNSVDPATVELLDELRKQKVAVEFHIFMPPVPGQVQDAVERQWMTIRQRYGDLTRLLLKRYQKLGGGEGVTIHDHDLYGDVASTRDAVQRFDYRASEMDVLVVAVRPEGREWRFQKLSMRDELAEIELPGVQATTNPMPRVSVPVLKDYHGELKISSTLKSLLVQGTPVACFLDGYSPGLDKEGASGASYSRLRQGLRMAGFEVRDIDLRATGRVPPDAALVIVLEPRSEFTDRDAEALYEYVKRGGCLFINYSWGGVVDGDWNPTGGKLGELLGYELSRAPVFHLMRDVTGGRAGGLGIAGPGVEKVQVYGSALHPVTRRIVQGGRPLEVEGTRAVEERTSAPAGMRREPLLQTGNQGWLGVPGGDGFPLLFPPQGIGLHPFVVGMSIELDAEAAAPSTADVAPRTGRVAIVSGVFCNNARVQQFGDLAFNICNWMAERRVLLDIHGSRYEVRSLQLNQPQLDRIWLFMFYGVPGTFFVLGSVVIWLRRRP